MKTRTIVMLLTLAMAGVACAPAAPLEIGSKEIPVDITLGNQQAPARPPALNPSPGAFPGFIQPPLPRIEPGDVPPPVTSPPCPIANPLDAAELVARQEAPLPPRPATYRFRNQGEFTIGDAAPVAFPPVTERTVTEVRPAPGDDYEFDVAVGLANETTTTTYFVRNDETSLERGIFITSIVTERSDGADAFIPEPPILLMPFPPAELGTNLEDELADVAGPTYRSSGTDPISQTTMILEAQIASKERVDACGEWIDSFNVEVVTGRILGPGKQIEFTGSYAIATQYGALVVADDIRMTGTDNFEPIDSRNRARISRLPKEPDGTP